MLFKERFLSGIARGEITVAFRRWRRPTVRAGGSLITPVGVLAITRVDRISESEIKDADARRAGYESRPALLEELRERSEGAFYRIEFQLHGPDPRVALRQRAEVTEAELSALEARLTRLDRASATGAWTRQVLNLIAALPATRAATLAARLDHDVPAFKVKVRRLKALGLTESLELGYRLSPRGKVVLARLNGRGQ